MRVYVSPDAHRVIVRTFGTVNNASVITAVTVDADYVVAASVGAVIAVDGCDVVTLPSVATNANRMLVVKNASSTTVTVAGGDDIDTESSVTLSPWEALTLISNGDLWVIV